MHISAARPLRVRLDVLTRRELHAPHAAGNKLGLRALLARSIHETS